MGKFKEKEKREQQNRPQKDDFDFKIVSKKELDERRVPVYSYLM